MIKIEGTKMNSLKLYLDGQLIGKLDVDHKIANLDLSQKELNKKFLMDTEELNYLINDYYNEVESNEDGSNSWPTVDYQINYKQNKYYIDRQYYDYSYNTYCSYEIGAEDNIYFDTYEGAEQYAKDHSFRLSDNEIFEIMENEED